MNTKKREELLNENIDPQIDDLPVTDEQARLTTGGRTDNGHGTHVAGTFVAVTNNSVG